MLLVFRFWLKKKKKKRRDKFRHSLFCSLSLIKKKKTPLSVLSRRRLRRCRGGARPPRLRVGEEVVLGQGRGRGGKEPAREGRRGQRRQGRQRPRRRRCCCWWSPAAAAATIFLALEPLASEQQRAGQQAPRAPRGERVCASVVDGVFRRLVGRRLCFVVAEAAADDNPAATEFSEQSQRSKLEPRQSSRGQQRAGRARRARGGDGDGDGGDEGRRGGARKRRKEHDCDFLCFCLSPGDAGEGRERVCDAGADGEVAAPACREAGVKFRESEFSLFFSIIFFFSRRIVQKKKRSPSFSFPSEFFINVDRKRKKQKKIDLLYSSDKNRQM